MRDDPLKNLAIVQAVKDVPKLYERETGIPKAEVERLWKTVGGKLNLPGLLYISLNLLQDLIYPVPTPGIEARDRWRVIRGSYVRYLRSMESESAPKKEYYLAKYLEFVKPFLKLRDSLPSSVCTAYDEEEVEVIGAKRQKGATPLRRSPKRVKRDVSYAEENRSLKGEEPEEDELEEQPEEQDIMIEEDLEDSNGDAMYRTTGALTYTLRNGQLMDSKGFATPVASPAPLLHSTVVKYSPVAAAVPVSACAPSDEERNPDLLFFKSLLPQMTNWTKKQKNKFKVAVLTAMDEVDES